ncbi:MAG: hypothetical protein E7576_14955 [Ruminococcaceae bacterium]|nr:hypothetical protein [Oscillospiraceae bacterium]
MSVLFSGEFFGIVMTLVGCMLFTSGDFSLFRTVLAAALTLGGISVTLKTSRKWLLVLHVLAWGLALALPHLPKPVGNLYSVLCTAALIPFVLNVLRLIIRRLVGTEDNDPSGK